MRTVLPSIPLAAENITILSSAKQYAQSLLTLIATAKTRIYITALYLQDDEAGQQVLTALYEAKKKTPTLDIKIFVDFHRAQRGLIGDKTSNGNRDFYLAFAEKYKEVIQIYGIGVKRKELLGVWHFKGMVFDDTVLYTGASINNIYLHQENRYRLDRYYSIVSTTLADSFCQLLDTLFIDNQLAPQLNVPTLLSKQAQQRIIAKINSALKIASYSFKQTSSNNELSLVPLIGLGRRKNQLNQVIRQQIKNAKSSLIIFTPYFNLPKPLLRDLNSALKRGVNVIFIIGDKKANDFYIADDNEFSTIGIIPYIYENLLKTFLKGKQKFLDSEQLEVRLWQHESNSFHLKGLITDNRWHLLTGNNFNPRAWALDVENGLLIDDPGQKLMAGFQQEYESIAKNTQRITSYLELEQLQDYPEKPQKLLRKLKMVQIDRLLKRFL
jgi:CDP-diacylglycerol--serine O-phosphatidyltransferase